MALQRWKKAMPAASQDVTGTAMPQMARPSHESAEFLLVFSDLELATPA
jgi:hypothetical protein